MSKPLVTITTGNSNSGSSCIKELYSNYPNKLKIRAVFRSEQKAEPFRNKYEDLEIITGVDADKPDTLDQAFKGSNYALIVTPHDHTRGYADDSRLTKNMINSAYKNNVNYIIIVTSWTSGRPNKALLLSARFIESEKLVEKLGYENPNFKWTVLRGGVFMENVLAGFKKDLSQDSIIHYPAIQCPLVDTSDIGKSAAACLASDDIEEHNKKIYDMNGPEILTGDKMADVLSKVLNREIKFKEIPKQSFRSFMPEAIAQVFENMVDDGKNAVPFEDHVLKLTGQNGNFENFIRNHLNQLIN